MDRAAFFDVMRAHFGKLNQREVEGTEALLDAGRELPLPYMANVLAQVRRETGGGMFPIKETVMPWHTDKNPSDKEVIRRLDHAWKKGALPWVKSPYWRGGWFGRGQIQITHEDNYVKFGLANNPAGALEVHTSARIAVDGMTEGLFTGKKLADYEGETFDHYNARSIVNGDKKKVEGGKQIGTQIADYAAVYEDALRAGLWTPVQPDNGLMHPDPAEEDHTGLSGLLVWLLGVLRR